MIDVQKGKSLSGSRCVIIFDEVQLFPPARQAIKYLVADGRYDYIETGSLIPNRKNVKDILIPSEEYRLKMYPMDFEEYLWEMGDTGLLVTQMMRNSDETGDNLYKSLVFDKLGIHQGMIIENMVAQMLRASGHDLYNKSPSVEYEFHTLRKGIFSERIFL